MQLQCLFCFVRYTIEIVKTLFFYTRKNNSNNNNTLKNKTQQTKNTKILSQNHR